MKSYKWIFWTTLGVTLMMTMSMYCITILARKSPLNYICIMLYTGCLTYMLGAISMFEEIEYILIASCFNLAVYISLANLTLFVSISAA